MTAVSAVSHDKSQAGPHGSHGLEVDHAILVKVRQVVARLDINSRSFRLLCGDLTKHCIDVGH